MLFLFLCLKITFKQKIHVRRIFFSAKPLLMILRSKIINFRYLLYIYIIIYVFIIQSIGYGLAKRFTNKKEK